MTTFIILFDLVSSVAYKNKKIVVQKIVETKITIVIILLHVVIKCMLKKRKYLTKKGKKRIKNLAFEIQHRFQPQGSPLMSNFEISEEIFNDDWDRLANSNEYEDIDTQNSVGGFGIVYDTI